MEDLGQIISEVEYSGVRSLITYYHAEQHDRGIDHVRT